MARRFLSVKWLLLLSAAMALISSFISAMEEERVFNSGAAPQSFPLDKLVQWRSSFRRKSPEPSLQMIAAAALCFIASAVCSAGGVGGGSLFLPILNLVAGIDLKTASKFSAFMVAGCAASNVLYSVVSGAGSQHVIDYDIALLSEPCMLLGVTVGVVCNVAFPEWLVTLLFAIVLSASTFKICRAGAQKWRDETEEMKGKTGEQVEGLEAGETDFHEPLLQEDREAPLIVRMKKVTVLVVIWLCFFLLQYIRQDKGGKGATKIKRCGVGYWLITLSQVPVALLFTSCIIFAKNRQQRRRCIEGDNSKTVIDNLPKVIFPVAALLAGVLGGLFGLGGGLLMNPVLLQIGVPPQTTAATSCFMVLFSASMSSMQYLMMGMKEIRQVMIMAVGCGITSMGGVVLIEKAIGKYGRASLVIFSLGTVMVLSSISITGFGLVDIWKDYVDGINLGFKLPC